MELKTIQLDMRGSINVLVGELRKFHEVTVFVTNQDFSRGGCIHPNSDEWCCLIEGSVSYVIGSETKIMNAGDVVCIPKNTPHYFKSLTHSVMLEWGATVEEKQMRDPDMRVLVESMNAKLYPPTVIDILKDISWINELEPYTAKLREIHQRYILGLNDWFNPYKYREDPLSRLWPNTDKTINYRPEYKLPFYLSNYLPLFLIRELYKDRKDIQIEDVGAGNGNLIYYLAKSGFKNFDTFDKWCESPRLLFEDMMGSAQVSCRVNDLSINPVVIHNASAPRFCYIAPGFDNRGFVDIEDRTYYRVKRDLSNVELICFYSNLHWEGMAYDILRPLGYSFLCQDTDHVGVAWCRNDKLKEFSEKIAQWKVG